ncbi:MAG: aspartate kinase [Bacilli bacterium]
MKVAKFGGSSVASATQFRKVAEIVRSDAERKYIVVSAPGKRFKEDIKLTDRLIHLWEAVQNDDALTDALAPIVSRYEEIAQELGMATDVIAQIETDLLAIIDRYRTQPDRLLDALKASGEDNNAKLMSAYFTHLGLKSTYVSPKEAGIIVTDEPGNAQIIPSSYEKIAQLTTRDGICVIPGFFGISETGDIVTFPRGGSDITGSIVARGVSASLYENFTDVDSIYCVNPTIVQNPYELSEITYREMRELSYSGFSVFHDEALFPVVQVGIPVCVKNTNNPSAPGTRIVPTREHTRQPIAGIASDKGFTVLSVSKYLMNRELGFGRRLLMILEEEGISFEHAPSGIDNMSVIFRSAQLAPEREAHVLGRIRNELFVDEVTLDHSLALIMVVGEGMQSAVGLAARATNAFASANINLDLINQGASEVSMMFGIRDVDVDDAVRALYNAFFSEIESAVR